MSNPDIINKYANWQLFVDKAVTGDSELPEMSRLSHDKFDTKWFGSLDIAEAQRLALYGWPEGLKTIRHITKSIREEFIRLFPKQDFSEEIKKDIQGGSIDVVSFLSGQPDCMTSFKENPDNIIEGNKLQRIIVECVCNCDITAESLFNRGAVICAAIEALELYGFRLEVIMQITIRSSFGSTGKNLIVSCPIKKFDHNMDYDLLAFALTHASVLRRFMFSLMEQMPEDLRKEFSVGRGYGRAWSCPVADTKDIYIPHLTSNLSIKEAKKTMIDLLIERFSVDNLWAGIDEHNRKAYESSGKTGTAMDQEDDSEYWKDKNEN